MFQNDEDKRTFSEVLEQKWLALYYRTLQICAHFRNPPGTNQSYKEIYVVFREGPKFTYWQSGLDDKFTHAFLLEDSIKQNVGNGLMQYDFLFTRIKGTHVPVFSIERYIRALKYSKCKVLKVKPFARSFWISRWYPKLVPYNCISLIKMFLGIKAFWVITPKQLYKHLVKFPNVTIL